VKQKIDVQSIKCGIYVNESDLAMDHTTTLEKLWMQRNVRKN